MSIMMEKYLRDAGISTPMGRVLDKALSEANDWGIRWQEFGKDDRIVTKEKFFSTEDARDKFADQIEKKDNFKEFEAWSTPISESYAEDREVLAAIFDRNDPARKPAHVGEALHHVVDKLSDVERKVVKRLPEIKGAVGDDFSFEGTGLPQYFRYNFNGKTFLVDTQGFNYPRYTLYIP